MKMQQKDEMMTDYCTIIFGNDPERLLVVVFPKRERDYIFLINTPFNYVLETIRDEWEKASFDVLYIQAPTTIESLIPEFYEYHNLPLPTEQSIRKKIQFAEKFVRFLKRRFSSLFPGSEFLVVEPSIEMFIRDSSTGEFLPSMGRIYMKIGDGVIDPIDEEQLEREFTLENFQAFLERSREEKEAEVNIIYHRIFGNNENDCFYAIEEICSSHPDNPSISFSTYYLISITLVDFMVSGGMFSAYVEVELAEELITELKSFSFKFPE